MPFAPAYVRIVLNENFEDAKALLLAPLMAIHYAHLAMLAEQRIVSNDQARAVRAALDGIDLAAVGAVAYDGTCEDLFYYLDRLIVSACGDDAAGRLHTARSRNDIDMTMYRMRIREWVLDVADGTLQLRRSLVELSSRHVATVYPAHTHTQPAQPSTVAHYLLAAIEEFERHTTRLLAAYRSVNRNPLGACAITGTAFPIDRDRTSALLGFDGPTGNTYGSIATVDYLLESAGATANALVGLGRLLQDLLLWCTREVGYLRLPDGFVQGSSIMPQKRNPVALEHARAIASKGLAEAAAIQMAVHNTPFGDIVDTEDDLQPLVATAFKDAVRAITLVAAALAGAEFDVAKMRARATEGWVTLTELADMLARDHGLPFKHGHAIAAALVRGRSARADERLSDLLAAASTDITGREIRLSEDELSDVLSPEHFIAVRRTWGGPAPDVTTAALEASSVRAAADELTVRDLRAGLAAADARRRQAVDAL
jgi:argininosuccinate lyase